MYYKLYYLIFVILLFNFTYSVAFDRYQEEEAIYKILQDIVSSVSKYEQKISEVPAIVSIVTRTQIENSGARNLLDIIKTVPGIETFINLDGYYEVAFRGVRGTANVLFMLDGIRLNNFYDGQSLYNFSSDNIERIEVIRGPGSSIHGTNAFVGIINIISRFHEEGLVFKTTFGDWNTKKVSTFYGKDLDNNKKLSLWANFFITDGQNNLHLKNNINDNNIHNDVEQNYLNIMYSDDFRHYSLNIIKEDRGTYIGSDYRIDDRQQNQQQQIILNYFTDPSNIFQNLSYSVKTYAGFSDYNKIVYHGTVKDKFGVDNCGFSKISYKTQTLGTEILFNYEPAENHTIVSGLQLEYLSLSGYRFLTNFQKLTDLTYLPEITNPMEFFLFGTHIRQGTYMGSFDNYHLLEFPQNNQRFILGFFLQDEWRVHNNFITTAGIRFDHYSDFGSTFNPKIGIVSPFLISEVFQISLKGSFATAFRAPTFQELYDRSQISTKNGSFGNPNLKPEKITSFEFGGEFRFLDKFFGAAYYFNNSIKDNIFAQNVNKQFGAQGEFDRYENINGIDISGFEWELKYNHNKYNYSFLNYSFFKSKNNGGYIVSQDANGVHRTSYTSYMTEVPQSRFNAGLNFDGSIFGVLDYTGANFISCNISYHYGSERFSNLLDVDPKSGFSYSNSSGRRWFIDEYDVINMSLRTTEFYSEKFQFQLSVFNLTDEKLYDNYNDVSLISTGTDWTSEKLIPKSGRYYEIIFSVAF